MKVELSRVHPAGMRWRTETRRYEWMPAFAAGLVDGHLVKVSARHGWTCNCPDEDCAHPDAMAAVIAPKLLARLEGDENTTHN